MCLLPLLAGLLEQFPSACLQRHQSKRARASFVVCCGSEKGAVVDWDLSNCHMALLGGVQGLRARLARQGRDKGNLLTSPSFAAVLLLSCFTFGFVAPLVALVAQSGIPIHSENYLHVTRFVDSRVWTRPYKGLRKGWSCAGKRSAEQKTTEFPSSKTGA